MAFLRKKYTLFSMNKNYLSITVVIFILLVLVFFIVGCSFNNKQDIQKNGNLLEEIMNSNSIVWIGAHPDDEIFVSGLLALSSLGYKKETYVMSLNKKAYATSPGTPEDRLQDNQDIKNFLGLKDYDYFEESATEYTDNTKKRFFAFLDEFISKNNIDLIVTFENTHGGNGHPEHIKLSGWLTEYSKDNTKLYYYINKNPIDLEKGSDPLPITDTIYLDEYYITDTEGNEMSIWDAKVKIYEIYSSSVPGAYILTQNPEILADAIHEEHYRKVN